jgi:formiminoglutamase
MGFKNIHTQDYQFHANPEDPRVVTKLVNAPEKADYVLSGYPDEEGIKLNGGRMGASLAPHEVRKAFYKMTIGCLPPSTIYDAGNVSTELDLADRHKVALLQNEKFYRQGKFVMSIGGGHDYGYPDAQAFLNAHQDSKLKPVVINFDAHLDVRPTEQGLTSGTPFYRMLTANPKSCHFFEVGIQSQCNSKSHLEWCESQGGHIIMLDDIEKKNLFSVAKKTFARFKKNPCFISVDIDAFSSAYAPGCSQSWPVGLKPEDFLKTFDFLFQQFDIKGIGIYEVSPPLDVQPLTSRLAALILYRCLQNRKGAYEKSHKRDKKPKRIRQR